MAIEEADIKIYATTNSLGGAITSNEVMNVANNIFDEFTGAETSAGGTFYACFYVKNEHALLTAKRLRYLIQSETDHDGVNVSLALGSAAINGTEQTIADESTAPTGVDFDTTDSDSETSGAGAADNELAVGNLPNSQHKSFWVRVQIAPGTSAKTGYTASTQFIYDTAE